MRTKQIKQNYLRIHLSKELKNINIQLVCTTFLLERLHLPILLYVKITKVGPVDPKVEDSTSLKSDFCCSQLYFGARVFDPLFHYKLVFSEEEFLFSIPFNIPVQNSIL